MKKYKDFGWRGNVLIASTTLIFGILFFIDIFISFMPPGVDRTQLVLTLLLFQIGILIVYLLSEMPKRNTQLDNIENNTISTKENLRSTAQSLNTLTNINTSKLLSGEALNSEYFLFDGFNENEYFAVNAPLQFELHNPIRRQIDIHVDRYKSPALVQAHYSYPIFSVLSDEEKKLWAKGIVNFLEQLLKEQLTDDEKKKVLFYLPKKDENYKTKNFSYFIGSKIGIKQCITYLHSEPYFNFELRKPNSILIIYSDSVINSIQDIIIHENMRMEKIIGIDNFIGECKKIIV